MISREMDETIPVDQSKIQIGYVQEVKPSYIKIHANNVLQDTKEMMRGLNVIVSVPLAS